ncbi:hypothetical protein IC620_09725 [Hazenella sp. IB182357]|uniref:Uncharacterized protein n=1 Tax=Polycladospora coralii TaxID=2771432 RepID=A0A926RUJ2_9BACL|nr:hypothetical protein [Polycladospora coralii]MBD1372632.1 hypothetical protein [Polycladospora coralii]MBS7531260.1 hypothetical protein [Polycladospora coralii]
MVDLTGTWKGDDDSTTYIQQIAMGSSAKMLQWYSIKDSVFSNIFVGTFLTDVSSIQGNWVDAPPNGLGNQGTLELSYNPGEDIIFADAASENYGTTTWTRIG